MIKDRVNGKVVEVAMFLSLVMVEVYKIFYVIVRSDVLNIL